MRPDGEQPDGEQPDGEQPDGEQPDGSGWTSRWYDPAARIGGHTAGRG